jgi:hypothetical protein
VHELVVEVSQFLFNHHWSWRLYVVKIFRTRTALG